METDLTTEANTATDAAESRKKAEDGDKLDLGSMDLAEERRAEILRLFPEVRTEGGKIDFERLKLALGEMIDVGRERYGMNWPGKAECFRTIQRPSIATLRPARDESVNFDTTENLIIEGDNLEVLKLLQKSYLGKVKMIYIDPPYNTGNDFIYPDNYTESLQTYLEYTGQVDAQGKRFSTNTEADGRFHSKWMNMMYPRLWLARNLLRDDGVMFISIDDGEKDNLVKTVSEIFGEESLIGTIVWRRRQVSDNRNLSNFSEDHEYVLVVSRSNAVLLGESKDLTKYSNPDNDPRGPWMSDNLTGLATAAERPNLHYEIVDPETGARYPPLPSRGWCYEPARMKRAVEEGRILFPSRTDGRPRLKRFLSEIKSEFTGFSSLQEFGLTQDGTRELEELFGEKILGFPKPTTLISGLLGQASQSQSNDLVVDFFAGSGTTAAAVFENNRQDGGNRKFILVQLPEPTDRDDYKTIADITKERVRRVIKKLNEEDARKLDLNGGKKQDRGFRVFKLAESNFKSWNADAPKDSKSIAEQLELHVEHVRTDRTPEDLLFEILLKSGYPLTARIETLELEGKKVFSIAEGALLVCLEKELTLEAIRAIAARKPERVVCLDSAFAANDQLKANAVQIFKALHRRSGEGESSSDVTVFRTV
jgi:adenine-specific DNA-methyltransferase